jgi:putative endopeptidase
MTDPVRPGDDFFQYVNGEWIRAHPVPPDKSSYDAFTELNDATEERLHLLVEDLASGTEGENESLTRKISDFYRTGMDTTQIEREGFRSIEEILDRIMSIQDFSGVQNVVVHLVSSGIDPLFGIFSEVDSRNSKMMIAGVSQSGLGLPNKEYYIRKDAESEQIREHYRNHIANMNILLGETRGAAQTNSDTVMNMETRLAKASFSPEENRDPALIYHKMDRERLRELISTVDWAALFGTLGYPAIQEVNVHQPRFLAEMDVMLGSVAVDDWKIFLRWKLISSLAPFLDSRFENENFRFYGTVLNGQPKMKTRWKRVLRAVDFALGEGLGKLYVEKYFPKASKESALAMVRGLHATLRSRIESLPWMGAATRKEALEKLARMEFKIGYPDSWQDYQGLEVGKDSYVLNALRAMRYDLVSGPSGLSRADKPVDRNLWYMHPQTINAYYDPGRNEFICPAGILQPPFFSADAQDAVNYGAIGAVIGHEMTHGFDDMGRKFDKEGNLRDWWSPEDEQEFSIRARLIEEQFDAFEVLPGLPANGKLTLGENIADLGGLIISCHAYDTLSKERKTPREPDMRQFFFSYAKVWRETIRKEALRNRVLSDEHAPNRLRVNGPLFNIPEFYAAFLEIQPDNALYRPPDKRPDIW